MGSARTGKNGNHPVPTKTPAGYGYSIYKVAGKPSSLGHSIKIREKSASNSSIPTVSGDTKRLFLGRISVQGVTGKSLIVVGFPSKHWTENCNSEKIFWEDFLMTINFSQHETLVLAADLIRQALAVTDGAESLLGVSDGDRLVENTDAFCATEKGMNVLLAVPTVLRLFCTLRRTLADASQHLDELKNALQIAPDFETDDDGQTIQLDPLDDPLREQICDCGFNSSEFGCFEDVQNRLIGCLNAVKIPAGRRKEFEELLSAIADYAGIVGDAGISEGIEQAQCGKASTRVIGEVVE